MERFITLTEAAKILGIEEGELTKLVEKGEITAYRIGGNFLRFKLKNIEEYKKKTKSSKRNGEILGYSWKDKIYDFFYYYDFYIIIILLIVLLLIIVFKF